jgi:hypothetical protein
MRYLDNSRKMLNVRKVDLNANSEVQLYPGRFPYDIQGETNNLFMPVTILDLKPDLRIYFRIQTDSKVKYTYAEGNHAIGLLFNEPIRNIRMKVKGLKNEDKITFGYAIDDNTDGFFQPE